jgi:hypothetical protein
VLSIYKKRLKERYLVILIELGPDESSVGPLPTNLEIELLFEPPVWFSFGKKPYRKMASYKLCEGK